MCIAIYVFHAVILECIASQGLVFFQECVKVIAMEAIDIFMNGKLQTN